MRAGGWVAAGAFGGLSVLGLVVLGATGAGAQEAQATIESATAAEVVAAAQLAPPASVPTVAPAAAALALPTAAEPAIVPSAAFAAPAVVDELPAQHSPVPLAAPKPAVPALEAPATAPAANATAPAPAPAPSGAGRKIVYSNSQQRVWLYESDGRLADTWLVSGRRGVPRPGTYAVFSKSATSRSANGAVGMQWMVRFARGRSLAIGFHSIPVGRRGPIQSLAELGRFRSAGCVRQAPANAKKLWDFAPIGTRVVVTA